MSVAIFSGTSIFQYLTRRTQTSTPKTTIFPSNSASITTLSGSNPANSILNTIKLVYFRMAIQTTGTSEEYLVFPAPTYLQDVLSALKEKHAVLVVMLPNMQIVIDGVPAEGNPQLRNHDEIDFIPIFAGG